MLLGTYISQKFYVRLSHGMAISDIGANNFIEWFLDALFEWENTIVKMFERVSRYGEKESKKTIHCWFYCIFACLRAAHTELSRNCIDVAE